MAAKMTPAVRALEQARIGFKLLEYQYDPDADEIGLHAARSLGRPASAVFKTLIVAVDSRELVCAVIPSDARLNLKAIASASGSRQAELAEPGKAQRTTGYVVGGISPFGQRKRLRTYIDATAASLDEVLVNGGRRGLQIALRPCDLIAATAATVLALQA
jgi:Cys-tRNA(Pro)/Cys-tRNA(Cys) deacylase